MTKKRIIIAALSCLLVLTASFGITYAYLIATDSKENQFTVGENTIEVVEEYVPPQKLEPGLIIEKAPKVENTGNLPCFVRMRADFSDSNAKEFCKPLVIGSDWEYDESDGYYYYTKVLQPGKSTQSLFETVEIKTHKDSDNTEYTLQDMIDFDILIYAESCEQGEHNENDYKTVWQ